MREIKFRAWDGHSMARYQMLSITMNGQLEYDGGSMGVSPIDYPLMQFTGLTDMNGVEIYEGDIIDIHQTVNGCNIFVVEWHKLGWSVKYCCDMVTPRFYEYDVSSLFEPCKFTDEVDFEVIGNTHQNPELLER